MKMCDEVRRRIGQEFASCNNHTSESVWMDSVLCVACGGLTPAQFYAGEEPVSK